MILTEKVNVIINSSNINHYKKLGYNVKVRNIININVEELTLGSSVIVEARCDKCGHEKKIQYYRYIENIKKYNFFSCCRKCATDKRIKTTLEKYGVENISQTKESRDKSRQTCLDKYGFDNYTKTDEYKERSKITNLERYGVDNPNKNKEVREKIKKTNLERYGVDNPNKNKEVREKTKNTCLEKYGVEYFMLTQEFIDKSKLTSLEKYGVENYTNSDKMQKTSLDKYGVNSYTKTDEYKDKTKKTCLKRYGVDSPNKNKEIRKKSIETRKINRLIELKKYDIVNIDYDNNIYTFNCDCGKDHIFDIDYDTMKNRRTYGIPLCTICNDYLTKSGDELNIYNFIKENYTQEIITSCRNIIKPYEIDIYIPELKLAIEYNGLYWHNEITKDKNYHLNKTEMCDQQGIQLIHIYEDDWLYKQDIVKSIILNKLDKVNNIILDQNIEIKEISDNKSVKTFLEKNHILGFIGSKIKIGLFYNNELVSLMTFGNKNGNKYELLRFCNKLNTNVISGASKIFNYFIKNYNPIEITTYADRSISQGKIYKTLGFIFIEKIEPDYYYIIGKKRNNKFNYKKNELIKQGFDSNKTTHEIMLERKFYRIYDSGYLKFRYQ